MSNKKMGTMKETHLHAGLKAWYAQAGGQVEQMVEGYVIDLVRGEELVEIQTGSFGALREKLKTLLESHVVRVVYPVAVERWILRIDKKGKKISRRKSPRRGNIYTVFDELTGLHEAVAQANFRLEIALVREEQVWKDDGLGSWRRKHWSLADRKLLSVVGQEVFDGPSDFVRLLPERLPAEFTTADLMQALDLTNQRGNTRRLIGRMARTLRQMGVIQWVGKRSQAYLYSRFDACEKSLHESS